MRRELRELKGDQQALQLYIEGMAKLRASGVLNALRALGRPVRHNTGKDPNQMASEASWSAGWNDYQDALMHFQEMYLDDPVMDNPGPADFGAVEVALERGDITKEEYDARKRGHYPKPAPESFTNNIKLPTRS